MGRMKSTWFIFLFVLQWNRSVSIHIHYSDVIMGTMVSQIASLTIAYSTVYSDADPRKNQSSASLVFVREIHRWPLNSPHKWPVTRKMFPFDDIIMTFMIHEVRELFTWRARYILRKKSISFSLVADYPHRYSKAPSGTGFHLIMYISGRHDLVEFSLKRFDF